MKMLGILLSLLVAWPTDAATWNITYPRPMSEGDSRQQYPLQLLRLALEKTGVNYRLQATDRILLQSRALKQLKSNREISVLWSMTDEQREQDLLPIRIPIYKGLIGLRIPLVRAADEDLFKYVQSMEKLTLFTPLSGHDWPDTKILQANGFVVVTEEDYQALFTQLASRHGDFFPRSVVEIWDETEKADNIIIEPHIALHYPTAMYFFVNKKSAALARLIESGLEQLIASGEFEQLFLATHQDKIERAALQTRRVFRLNNPILPAATPLDRAELWQLP
ncbi:amino acid ABC transporter substrate-binding protein [Lacimicrobium sp. SS2-24]|uniref:amino acid ABC transporter substrate-binding protein n=1 Tax=Lacimicrobium sp. SS2-24 TaxID=2005569 RepID=UPI001AEF892C|nr:amino acid ABC transporter substrate-binding protein [Lacimicrobium sp. SS2-24]